MKEVGLDDLYEVRTMSLVSDVDIRSLVDLYEPLIGAQAVALYLTLLQDNANSEGVSPSHDSLLAKTLLSPGAFYKAIESLEAVGLIRTYFQQNLKTRYFVYCLYSPKDPKEFFDDVLFVGTLKKYVGQAAFEALVRKYQTPKKVEGFEEVSTSFASYFNPDFDDPVFKSQLTYEAGGHNLARVKTEFNYSSFLESLANENIHEADLTKEERSHAEKLASLYSVDAETIAKIISDNYQYEAPVGKRIAWEAVEQDVRNCLRFNYIKKAPKASLSEISSDTLIARKIKDMDTMPPVKWLFIKQNGHAPAESDLKILENLKNKIGLPNPVINALVDWVLEKNDNILSKAYTEKVGAALAREGVTNALDAMNYLKRANKQYAPKASPTYEKRKKPSSPASPATPDSAEKPDEEEVSDEEVQKAIAALYNKK